MMCQLCGKQLYDPVPCTGCGSLFYCSLGHRLAHSRLCHAGECSRMAEQMSRSEEIFSTPFPWTPAYADAEAVARLMEDHGGNMTPIWQAECPQSAEEASDDLWQAAFEAWPLQEDFHRAPSQIVRLLGLPKELVPSLSQAGLADAAKLTGWKDYYEHRKLPLSCPVGAVMSTVLTLYDAVMSSTSAQAQRLHLHESSQVHVHMLGVHKEAMQWPLLMELCWLLPGTHLHIVMVSPSLPDDLPQQGQWESPGGRGSLQLTLCRGLYHNVAPRLCRDLGQPQLVLCPNAGLAAYSSWVPTVKLLLQSDAPHCFFTDYCEEAAGRAAGMCRALGSSSRAVKVALNPWRSPLRDMRAGTALPSCSNAFVISVL